ncbi:hypothetical protein [Chelativorans xinjiangense]|uniref:hypothetical protein n=1 Tax=Chelativorans xinjiangense TaxID=2681485 RepID=UPI00135C6177|nr:hypothetical protein [Chelativorans xinjiangense]
MYKIAVLTSALAMLGAGNAFAFDASRGFGPSDANDQPVPLFQMDNRVDRSTVTAGIGGSSGSTIRGPVGFSAAQGFGPSDASDQPVPRFQMGNGVDRTVTAGIGNSSGSTIRGPVGFSAAQGFGPSDASDQPVPRFQIAR